MNNALLWIVGMVLGLTLSASLEAQGKIITAVEDVSWDSRSIVSEKSDAGSPSSGASLSVTIIQSQIDAIDGLISQQGAYGSSLIEAYSDLGVMLASNGNSMAAAAAYRQAWHLSRINTGLYSEEQLPYLNSLITSLADAKEWQQVHDLHKLSFLISSRIYAPDDPEYSIAAGFYSNWQWQAINGRLLSKAFSDLFMQAQELSVFYTEVIDKIEHAGVPGNDWLTSLVVGKARTDIEIARALINADLNSSVLGPGSYITEAECLTKVAQSGQNLRQCRRVQLAGFAEGSGALLSRNFALARYLQQIEISINKLEQICGGNESIDPSERIRVENLLATLKRQTEGVYRSAGRIRT